MTDRAHAHKTQNAPMTGQTTGQTRLPQPSAPDSSQGERPGSTQGQLQLPISMEEIVGKVRHLPALPQVVMKVMQMTGQADCSAREIALVISNDQSFSARMLQLANSAYYGLPRNVGTISEAVVLLGMRTVRNMAITAATHDTLTREVTGYDLERGDLWRHSLACGMAAQLLAEVTNYPGGEEAFVAGLLHDIGKVVLSVYVRDAMALIRERLETEDISFLEAERAVLGFDHAEIGGQIARKWNLPPPLVQAIACHHQPMQDGQVAPLTALVHVANVICLTAGIGMGADGLRAGLSSAALKTLNLDERQIEKVLSRLVSRIAQAKPLFMLEDMIAPPGAAGKRAKSA